MASFLLAVGLALAALTSAAGPPMLTRDVTTTVLTPATHPSINKWDMSSLNASPNAILHYTNDGQSQATFSTATMSWNSAYAHVQLENSAYIKSVTCSSNSVEVQFSNQSAFASAVQNWQGHDPLLMVLYSPSCSIAHAANQRSFALARNITNDATAQTVHAAITPLTMEDAIGSHTPVTTSFDTSSADASTAHKRASKSESLTWNEYPTSSLSDSQWGPGYELYSSPSLSLTCVHCGTQGSMTLSGVVNWTASAGITNAALSLTGSMSMSMQLGLDARDLSDTIPIGKMSLAQVPLASIDVPGVMNIGPQLDISASASVTVSSSGSMLMGANLNWPDITTSLVLEGAGSTQGSGWAPGLTPVVTAPVGSLSASLDMDLPVELGIGVSLLDGKYNKTVGVVDTPALQVKAQASNAASQCKGVSVGAGVSNDVVGDIFGITEVPIASFSTQLYSTCLGGAATPTGGSSPTTTPSTAKRGQRVPAEKTRNGKRYRQVL